MTNAEFDALANIAWQQSELGHLCASCVRRRTCDAQWDHACTTDSYPRMVATVDRCIRTTAAIAQPGRQNERNRPQDRVLVSAGY